MSDKMQAFYIAFYGHEVPLSHVETIRPIFTKMAETLKSDLLEVFAYAETHQIREGILEGLRYMHSVGVSEPQEYLRNTSLAKEAFRHACASVRGKPLKRTRTPEETVKALEREQEATREAIDASLQIAEENAQRLGTRSKIAEALYRNYQQTKSIYLKNGEEPRDAKVKAYLLLLEEWEYQGGIDFYIMAMGLPIEESIYDEIEVINAQNAHRILPNRKETQMRVNSESWGGLK